jgi:hypothetical protein
MDLTNETFAQVYKYVNVTGLHNEANWVLFELRYETEEWADLNIKIQT